MVSDRNLSNLDCIDFLLLRFDNENLDMEFKLGTTEDVSNDVMLAQLLQHEFDREYDQELKHKESKFNADSKGNTI